MATPRVAVASRDRKALSLSDPCYRVRQSMRSVSVWRVSILRVEWKVTALGVNKSSFITWINYKGMRDNQHIMIELVKIIERFPEIYDLNLDSYRTRFSEHAWTKVVACVQTELHEECTVDELKAKWKGIRSSFNRYKAKLHQNNNEAGFFKKYYLYDHLRFLDPFVRPKGSPTRDQDKSCNFVSVDNVDGTQTHSDSLEEWNIEIKPDFSNNLGKQETDTNDHTKRSNSDVSYQENSKKRKYSMENKDADEESEDLQFFRSILPDIRSFTIKEKRKFKMGILKLIDDIENERNVEEES